MAIQVLTAESPYNSSPNTNSWATHPLAQVGNRQFELASRVVNEGWVIPGLTSLEVPVMMRNGNKVMGQAMIIPARPTFDIPTDPNLAIFRHGLVVPGEEVKYYASPQAGIMWETENLFHEQFVADRPIEQAHKPQGEGNSWLALTAPISNEAGAPHAFLGIGHIHNEPTALVLSKLALNTSLASIPAALRRDVMLAQENGRFIALEDAIYALSMEHISHYRFSHIAANQNEYVRQNFRVGDALMAALLNFGVSDSNSVFFPVFSLFARGGLSHDTRNLPDGARDEYCVTGLYSNWGFNFPFNPYTQQWHGIYANAPYLNSLMIFVP